MNLKDYVLGGVAAVALVLSVSAISEPAAVANNYDNAINSINQTLGAYVGPERSDHTFFKSALTRGGRTATTTDDATTILIESNFLNSSRLDFNQSVVSLTATLPATSTLRKLVPRPGDTQDVLLCSATSTAAQSFTLAAGTGMNLVQATSTLAITTGQCAQLTFSRQPDSDIDVFYDLGY